MKLVRNIIAMRFAAACVCAFAACTTSPTSTGPGSADDATARVDVLLTDAPAAYDAVLVTISNVEIGTAAGWVTLFDQPQHFDLLTLRNDATAALGGADLAPGSYTQLRLIVDSASVVVGGVESPLDIASGAQTGIKILLDADIAAGMTYTLVLDYDADKSIKSTGKGYLMTPVIRVKSLSGTPTGSGSGSDPGSGSGSDSGSTG